MSYCDHIPDVTSRKFCPTIQDRAKYKCFAKAFPRYFLSSHITKAEIAKVKSFQLFPWKFLGPDNFIVCCFEDILIESRSRTDMTSSKTT